MVPTTVGIVGTDDINDDGDVVGIVGSKDIVVNDIIGIVAFDEGEAVAGSDRASTIHGRGVSE